MSKKILNKKKPNKKNTKRNKNKEQTQTQTQTVHIHNHRTYTNRKPTIHKTNDSYQPRLPINHPFVNAPVSTQPLQSPVNVIIGELLKHKTSDTNTVAPPTPSVHTTPLPSTPVPTTPLHTTPRSATPSLPSRPL